MPRILRRHSTPPWRTSTPSSCRYSSSIDGDAEARDTSELPVWDEIFPSTGPQLDRSAESLEKFAVFGRAGWGTALSVAINGPPVRRLAQRGDLLRHLDRFRSAQAMDVGEVPRDRISRVHDQKRSG